jgi:hypothetical protein
MTLASSYVRYFDEPADIRTAEPLLSGALSGSPRMRALRLYVQRFDRSRHTLTGRSINQLIEENREDALAQGLTWKPAPSTLRRAIRMAEVSGG